MQLLKDLNLIGTDAFSDKKRILGLMSTLMAITIKMPRVESVLVSCC